MQLQVQQGIREEQRFVKRWTGDKVGVELRRDELFAETGRTA